MIDTPGLRHAIEALLNPFFFVLLVFIISLVGLYKYGKSRVVNWGLLCGLLGLLFISTGWLPEWSTRKLEDQYPLVTNINPAVKWVVVLSGGQSQRLDTPAHNLLYCASIKRLIEGVRLYRQLPHASLLLSGGGYGNEVPEARRLATLAGLFNIPQKDLVLETGSINTADQAIEIKKIINTQPFYLVTSAIHMPRSVALCKKQGLNPIAAPTDFTYYWDDERWDKRYLPDPKNITYAKIAWHEVLGRTWAWLNRRA